MMQPTDSLVLAAAIARALENPVLRSISRLSAALVKLELLAQQQTGIMCSLGTEHHTETQVISIREHALHRAVHTTVMGVVSTT